MKNFKHWQDPVNAVFGRCVGSFALGSQLQLRVCCHVERRHHRSGAGCDCPGGYAGTQSLGGVD